jgi:hypothetical protein
MQRTKKLAVSPFLSGTGRFRRKISPRIVLPRTYIDLKSLEPSSTAKFNRPVELKDYPARWGTSLFDLVPLHTCIIHPSTVRCAASHAYPGSRKRISDVDEDGLALQLETPPARRPRLLLLCAPTGRMM